MSLERFGVVPMSFQKWKLVYTNQPESDYKRVMLIDETIGFVRRQSQ